ncbi:type VI secretion system tip protein VgrG [Rhizobium sp. P44RR-XXIV]|nr:type VI secretion system tip protein TssI/VgrG [Rhizobium sp. P44RR-XXIV]TIX90996.1 type VI secretion system tip protein VgrG [Rhizobium sp. P44RR-XXIV]
MALEELSDTLTSEGFSQVDRIIRVETILGADVLLAEDLHYRAGINELFELRVDVRAKHGEIDPKRLIATLADVSLEIGQGQRKSWNGLIQGVTAGPPLTRGARAYALVIRPQLFLLSQKSDWRSWQHLSSVDVAEMLLSEHGLPAPDVSGVIHQPKPMVYSVQAGETDLDYLTRRLEADGIFYYFRHEGGQKGSVSAKHVLILADHQSGYDKPSNEADGKVRYALGSSDRNHINNWLQRFEYSPGRRTGADYNFLHVDIPTANAPSLIELNGNQKYELFEFGSVVGGYGVGSASEGIDNAEVEKQSRWRMQATEVDHNLTEGASTVRTLEVGQKFLPYDVANPANKFEEMVVHKIEVTARDHSYEAADQDEPEYANRFVALPARVPATPHRITSKPRIDGVHVGFIAGPEGEEIHTDPHGRIKLWMPWDRRAKKDGSDGPWVRVSQAWAGSTWGGQIIPRIGQEAMVAFIGGDPDRPVVLGLAPNAQQTVPYDLPANKTRSTFRSNSHKSVGFNEFSMEDKTGGENMFFHAQKDHTTRVRNDRTARIDSHDVHSVGGNRAVEVSGNQKHEIGGSVNTVVGGTGPMALALMGAVQGLSGHTAGLLAQAGQIAGGGGAGLAAFAGTVASSALGFLGTGGLASREGVVSGPSPRADAGTDLAGSGTGVGDAAGDLFPLSGIMNTVVGSFKSDTVGIARVEQIGVSKVTNVGQTSMESVGKFKKIAVGEEFIIECGDSKFIMKSNGEVIILGKNFNFVATEHFQMRGKPIDHN